VEVVLVDPIMAEEEVPVVSLLQLDNLFLRHQDLL
tara:strand:- start:304 stop:408 length:105 start_codon:yes stop_codon:yes gene_type:complete